MLLAVSLSCAFNGNAQITYRGFVEGGLGASIISGASGDLSNSSGFRNSDDGGGLGFSYMLATTHGIQLKNNFFGIGLGITPGYCAVGDYQSNEIYTEVNGQQIKYGITTISDSRISKVALPIYINWRYDFFNSSYTFKPYVGVKAGIFIPISEYSVDYQEYSKYSDGLLWSATDTGMLPFIAIDLGLRKRISDTSGMSFGLSIQNSNGATPYYSDGVYGCYTWLDWSLNISILAKLTFDF